MIFKTTGFLNPIYEAQANAMAFLCLSFAPGRSTPVEIPISDCFCTDISKDWLLKAMDPGLYKVMMKDKVDPLFTLKLTLRQAYKILKTYALEVDEIKSGKNISDSTSDHRSILHALVNSDLPSAEKDSRRLGDEASGLIGAGTLTT